MGGWGSGNWHRFGTQDTVDGYKALDVNWLHRQGCLRPGAFVSVFWNRRGEASGDICVQAEEDRVTLIYRSRSRIGGWEDVRHSIRITRTPCNFGGTRPWFVCPGSGCNRRVGKLYAVGTYFLCRHCYRLKYDSQKEGDQDRLIRKAQSIRMRLGGSASLVEPFPPKPKGMHLRTYWQLRETAEEAEADMWGMTRVWLTRLKKSLPEGI